MTDILLIYPPLSVDERYGNRRLGKVGGHLPPLGICSIAAYLRQEGFTVSVIDGPTSNITEDALIKRIKEINPRVIGISAITSVFHRAVALAKAIKKESADILTIIGGHHASILPKEALQDNQCFDLAVFGEGELTTLEIIKKYNSHSFNLARFLSDYEALSAIEGIVFRQKDNIVINPSRKPIPDLDILPYPAWDLLPLEKYIPLPNQYLNKPVINMVVIRGCAFQCGFCSNNAVFGRKIRAISPQRLIDMMLYVKKRFGAREVSFWDDSMTSDRIWLTEVCRQMIDHKIGMTWTCYSRVDTVDKEILLLMKKAGCWNIFYGFESGNQELLDIIDKKITLEDIRRVNRWTKEAGIEVRASFMIALPGENPQMAKKTIDFAISLEPDYVQFSVTTLLPKTRLYEIAGKYGRISSNFEEYNMWIPTFIPNGYRDKEEIQAMEKLAMRKFYFRASYIYGRVRKIRSLNDIIRYMKGLSLVLGFAA